MLRIELVNNISHKLRPSFGNYNYKVFVNRKIVGQGEVLNHDRSTGWQGLIKDLSKSLGEELQNEQQ